MVDVVAVGDEILGNTSYLVDLRDGWTLVIDPARHPGAYLSVVSVSARTTSTLPGRRHNNGLQSIVERRRVR